MSIEQGSQGNQGEVMRDMNIQEFVRLVNEGGVDGLLSHYKNRDAKVEIGGQEFPLSKGDALRRELSELGLRSTDTWSTVGLSEKAQAEMKEVLESGRRSAS